jgi:hypothetical protein
MFAWFQILTLTEAEKVPYYVDEAEPLWAKNKL